MFWDQNEIHLDIQVSHVVYFDDNNEIENNQGYQDRYQFVYIGMLLIFDDDNNHNLCSTQQVEKNP
jgi:hypothetical protein